MLLTAPRLSDHISGAILYDETIRQATKAKVPFTKLMLDNGILPGIKVDKGPQPLAGFPGEVVTEGLDGLRDRLNEYARLGAKFAKWRAVITIGDDAPSGTCIEANCHALARYAALCQEAGIVPMVEPEVLMDGEHDIEVCYDVTEATLRSLFGSLYEHNVMLEGTILKASMVISGKSCPEQASAEEVAEATVRCLKAAVPAALPGIVFLSGGQTDEQATAHLNAMNQIGPHPWPLSFSYARALHRQRSSCGPRTWTRTSPRQRSLRCARGKAAWPLITWQKPRAAPSGIKAAMRPVSHGSRRRSVLDKTLFVDDAVAPGGRHGLTEKRFGLG
jgi:fructose-bisphosphate aldolase class I